MLFAKESRKVFGSVTYWFYVAILIAFFFTQAGGDFNKITPPKQGQESYGMKPSNDPELIMRQASANLAGEYESNSYIAYPLGFYKNIKLNENMRRQMSVIVTELQGAQRPDYERFKQLMQQADKLIGGGSKYNETNLIRFGDVPKSYEDAVAEYTMVMDKDRVTGALARLFSDYIGIMLALLPVFVAVALGMKDRRAAMIEIVYSRRASSRHIVASRYFAMIAAMFLPVLLLAVYETIKAGADYGWANIDSMAFIKYAFGWLLPTLLTATAVGQFLTELTDTPLAVVVQGIWWYIGINKGIAHIDGGYGADLTLRHNIVGNTQLFLDHVGVLTVNRIGYTLLAMALLAATIGIFESKRRGKYDAGRYLAKIRLSRKSAAAL